jgi:hypothetical protein
MVNVSTFVVESVHTARGNKRASGWVMYTQELGNVTTCGRGINPLGRCVISTEESTDRTYDGCVRKPMSRGLYAMGLGLYNRVWVIPTGLMGTVP